MYIRLFLSQITDMIATPLRVSLVREEAVDFTTRFYEDIYSIFIRPKKYPQFYFIYPISSNYWMALLAVLIATWIILIIFGAMSKYTRPTKQKDIPTLASTLAMVVLRISLSQGKHFCYFRF